jgi:hypothetical protein
MDYGEGPFKRAPNARHSRLIRFRRAVAHLRPLGCRAHAGARYFVRRCFERVLRGASQKRLSHEIQLVLRRNPDRAATNGVVVIWYKFVRALEVELGDLLQPFLGWGLERCESKRSVRFVELL